MFTVSSTPLYVRNSYNSIKKKRKPNRKNGQKYEQAVYEEETQMAHKYMQRCLSSLVIRDTQIKRTKKNQFLPIRMQKF